LKWNAILIFPVPGVKTEVPVLRAADWHTEMEKFFLDMLNVSAVNVARVAIAIGGDKGQPTR
jgi:hypothetical protein